jgi:hypothetical protein
MRRFGIVLMVLLLLMLGGGALLYQVSWGLFGRHEGPGEIRGEAVPETVIRARTAGRAGAGAALGAPPGRQILFGDLHAHTTFSTDAFATSLPVMGGMGTNPPANACDFARYCSALDFWSINDHASNLTPRHWAETKESIRQCNARAGDPVSPDLVSFLGWEWTQVGQVPEKHYGHKNVVLLETEEDRVPRRPFAEDTALAVGGAAGPGALALLDDQGFSRRYIDFARYMRERDEVPDCPEGVDTNTLPDDCRERASTPADLFRKLREWGGEAIVIPHGTSWGFYTPPGSSWDKQLSPEQDDPELQSLFEIYSGHGNSEEYRAWRAVERGADGQPVCPAPSEDYLPSCWQAGEILRRRCRAAGEDEATCEEAAVRGREAHVAEGSRGFQVVAGQEPEDWLDAGQCRDCFLPAFNLRPMNSAQYVTAISNFEAPGAPKRARFGFIGSSDGHKAKPGIGYKQQDRHFFNDGIKVANRRAWEVVLSRGGDRSQWRPSEDAHFGGFGTLEVERTSAFMTLGGLAAVHAAGRGRHAIWDAMQRKEVYGTSGTKILLWFDLLNPPPDAAGVRGDGTLPMGSAAGLDTTPRFRVRAVGSFRQRPGCPAHAEQALGAERLAELCAGECDHPSDERKAITRIEVVRIRPQMQEGEDVTPLIEDPWRVLPCPADPAGCSVTFADLEFTAGARDVAYYVRAIEEPAPMVNADGLRCRRDAEGRCIEANPCTQDFRVDREDDCLTEGEERAWSSPIHVDFRRTALARARGD